MNLVRRLLKQKGHRVVTADANVALAVCARRMNDRGVGSLVILQDGALAGVLTLYDLGRAVGAEKGDVCGLTAADVMSPDPVTTTEDAELKNVERTMIEEQLHHVPVLRNGEVLGLITQRDILSLRLAASEEMNEELERYVWSQPPEQRMSAGGRSID